MDEIGDRAALDEGQRRRPPRHRLEAGGEPDNRLLLHREARALAGAQRLDDADACLGGGDVPFRCEHPAGDGSLLRAGAGGRVGGAVRLEFERGRPALGLHRLLLGAGEGGGFGGEGLGGEGGSEEEEEKGGGKGRQGIYHPFVSSSIERRRDAPVETR